VDVYSFGIDFCQIWYVFNLLKQVLGPFFMVLDLFFHFYFWTRNGSKMGFRPLVFKGLIRMFSSSNGIQSNCVLLKFLRCLYTIVLRAGDSKHWGENKKFHSVKEKSFLI